MIARAHALLAVDVVVFALVDGELRVRLVKIRDGPFAGEWAFPGGLVGAAESLETVARRELGADPSVEAHLEQLRTFGEPERDPRGRVVATAYLGLVPNPAAVAESDRYSDSTWADVRKLPPLAYDHDAMAAAALERLRAKLGYTSIVRTLLAPEFTLGELQAAYELILDRSLDRRNFRKKLAGTGLLREVSRRRRGAHRPAALYSFREQRLITVDIL